VISQLHLCSTKNYSKC